MARHARVVRSAAGVDVDQDVSGRGSTLLTAKLALRQRGVSVATRPPSHPMLAVALVVQGLVTPAIVTIDHSPLSPRRVSPRSEQWR